MSHPLLTDEIRERVEKAMDSTSKSFMDSIRPIYGIGCNGKLEHIGTCLLINWKSQRLLITAAHVIDENEHGTLYLGVGDKLLPIAGQFNCTTKPDGDRKKDHYDFAWVDIDTDTNLSIPDDAFLFDDKLHIVNGKLYDEPCLALGFPNSKNKIYKNSISPKFMKYWSTLRDIPDLCQKMGIPEEHHLFLDYHKDSSKDSDGKIIDSIKPTGISGGALIGLGSIVSLLNEENSSPKIVGMLIENPISSNVFVAVKISLILNTIDQSASLLKT